MSETQKQSSQALYAIVADSTLPSLTATLIHSTLGTVAFALWGAPVLLQLTASNPIFKTDGKTQINGQSLVAGYLSTTAIFIDGSGICKMMCVERNSDTVAHLRFVDRGGLWEDVGIVNFLCFIEREN